MKGLGLEHPHAAGTFYFHQIENYLGGDNGDNLKKANTYRIRANMTPTSYQFSLTSH